MIVVARTEPLNAFVFLIFLLMGIVSMAIGIQLGAQYLWGYRVVTNLRAAVVVPKQWYSLPSLFLCFFCFLCYIKTYC